MDLPAMDIPALGVWAWFLAGIVLMLLELVVPGVFLIWLGLAAVATGLVDLAVALSWQRELLLFAVLAIAFAILGRNLMRPQQRIVPRLLSLPLAFAAGTSNRTFPANPPQMVIDLVA